MVKINKNFIKLKKNYLFSDISKKIKDFQNNNPYKKIIKLGIGDVTKPLPEVVIKSLKKAVEEMSNEKTFKGYGPESGYSFLIEKIIKFDYNSLGIDLDKSEIFISEGAKSDTGNIGDIFSKKNSIAITDPVYPVYLDTNIMAGRKNIELLPCNKENNFIPPLPRKKADIIYLCFPNNPTGTVLTKKQLKIFIDYAKKNKSIILFDAAYEAFITEKDIPHSIYEIEGAREVAIEFKSFSKNAGFTGTRCAYTIIPNELKGYNKKNDNFNLNQLWFRRQSTKYNGVSYIIQKGAESLYSKEGQKQIKNNINYYLKNAKIIREGIKSLRLDVFGGINSPYIWLKTPKNLSSWDFFDILLNKIGVVGTPGIGFGREGEGYFRLTAFGSKENTITAIKRIKNLNF